MFVFVLIYCLETKRAILLSILLIWHTAFGNSANLSKTLTSKEDLSDIDIHEDLNENEVDKNKRELPKVQSAIINILKVS